MARNPILDTVAAVSVGIVDGLSVLDMDYQDDVAAEVDLNVVMSGRGLLIEVQGTAERAPFSRADLDRLLDLAAVGIAELDAMQRQAATP
jgi:ribonuclease PH